MGGHRHHHDHGAGHDHGGFDRHRNPEDFAAYLAKLEGEDRAGWQKPDEVVAALGLAHGQVACDAGAGPGYFTLRLARAVGPSGRVLAIDVEPRMLALLEARARAAGVSNVTPILATDGAPIPPEPCHVVLVVNTFHHFPDGVATLRRLATRLAPGGRIVNVDFHPGSLPVGPPPELKISRDDFLAAAREAGLRLVDERTFLPYQYFLALAPR
ncbi:class I SAM-dependent methyltransferase [Anaeromyxobacter oryzae]|uniref:Methyltransferase type 11 n=1 Tax=Anaeromyxobacter oryzae TaxID=2918170 RepID=A0ABM7WQN9_9BACT|nr:class I SAM-dependent methyltransferase [Anaeromyxobacter oryzae]BDG01774.1 methyltransferase type 11 [Anaeromyxobacter oryzae]